MISDEYGVMSFANRLLALILLGKNEEVQRILQEMDYRNMIDSSGKTMLHVAVEFKNDIITKYLIDAGYEVEAMDNRGDTPLILACQQNHTDVIKVLVEAKASVLISNKEGKSASEIVLGGTKLNVHILDPILERVKEECSNDSLQTAKELLRIRCSLTRALRLKDVEITKYMLDSGYNINDQDHQLCGWMPLHQALVFQDDENVKLLIDRGADVNVEDKNGVTPVNYAYYYDILESLLNRGAKVVDDDGTLIADNLFWSWEKEVIEMLITRYNLTDLSIRDREGTTIFHHLASNRKFDPVEILQKYFHDSYDINQENHRSSVLLSAVEAGNVGTVAFLLKRGAKFTVNNAWRDEVFSAVTDDFKKKNRKDREIMVMLLLQYGADIQWTSEDDRGERYFVLDFVLRNKHYGMVKIILARLALVEDLGIETKNVYRERIENSAMCKKYFEFCKRSIEKLKRTAIKRRVTLFDFMTCSEERLVNLARSEEFVATVQSIMYRKRHSNLYYYKVLRKRVRKAADVVDLRKGMSLYVNYLIPELQSNQIVIEKIVEYVIHEVLCFMAMQPTFKCITDSK